MEVLFASLIQKNIGQQPTKEGMIGIIKAVGGDISEEKINTFLSSLSDRNIDECIAEGREKMTSMQVSAPSTEANQGNEQKKEAEEEPEKKEEEVDYFDALF